MFPPGSHRFKHTFHNEPSILLAATGWLGHTATLLIYA